MFKKTFRISDEANEILKHRVKESGLRSESAYIEKLLLSENNSQKVSTEELLSKLLQVENDVNKKSYIILDMLNSFLTHGVTSPAQEYTNHEQEPHNWIQQAEQAINLKIYNQQIKKI